MADEFMNGYLVGNNENRGGNGMFGDGWWGIIILAMIFGWGNGGWGFGGMGGGMGAMMNGVLTRADLCSEFNFNGIENGVRGIQQGICDSTYALNNAIMGGFNQTQMGMMQGFNGVERQMCDLGYRMQDCCCQTQRAIDGVNYNMATNTCALQNTIQNTTRDIIEANNCNTRSILDFMVKKELSDKDAQIAELQRAASQDRQNAYLTTMVQAQVDRINPQPVPSYAVPAPYPYSRGYGSGYVNNGFAA